MKQSLIKPLIIILILLLFGLFFDKYLIQEEYTHYTSPKGEAKTNHYLALHMLLQKYGFDVVNKPEISEQNTDAFSDGIILVTNRNVYKMRDQLKLVVDTAEKGATVILASALLYSSEEPVINGINIMSVPRDESDDDFISEELNDNFKLYLPHNYKIETDRPLNWKLHDKHGIHAASIKWGSGELILMNSLIMFNNYNINDNDHAYFVVKILKNSKFKKLYHVYKIQDKKISDLLRPFYMPIAFLMLIIVLYIWKQWGYFGVVRESTNDNDLELLNHLRYIGYFYWKNLTAETIYNNTINDLEYNLLKHHTGWNALTNDEKIFLLVEKTDLPQGLIEATINVKPVKNKQKYIEFCHNVNKIRNAI